MTTKYTPGPWGAEPHVKGDWAVWSEPDTMACIAVVNDGVLPSGSVSHNARLIAAAPVLLGACESMLDAYEMGEPGIGLAILRGAIAKARGGGA